MATTTTRSERQAGVLAPVTDPLFTVAERHALAETALDPSISRTPSA